MYDSKKIGLYTVYDIVSGEAGPPFTAKDDAVASRAYHQLVSESAYPDDFELRKIGTYYPEECRVLAGKIETVDVGAFYNNLRIKEVVNE